MQCSPFGVIPKKGKPGKWRLILNLSAPEGHSVNDGIARELCRVKYISVDDVVRKVLQVGPGAWLAKADVQGAYRNVPVHPDDRGLLGMSWQGQVYVDATLLFGLQSAPLLFTALGDAVEWIAKARGAGWLRHYIDDFVAVGAPGSSECGATLAVLKETCRSLGMPLDPGKEEGPAQVLPFLGVELDTVRCEVRLPQAKLKELMEKVRRWRSMKSCTKRELLSIIGHLSHACKAVRVGRSFLQRLIDLSMTVRQLERWVCLNVAARADLEWWWGFGLHWNGSAMMKSIVGMQQPQVEVVTDASGNWGCGAVCGAQWFQVSWERAVNMKEWNIMAKEMLPITMAAAVWGRRWQGKTTLVRSDNMAVVATLGSGGCKEPVTMQLRRCLAFLEATMKFILVAEHIAGVDNVAADALSRGRIMVARSVLQEVEELATEVPERLLELLGEKEPCWHEREWGELRAITSGKD